MHKRRNLNTYLISIYQVAIYKRFPCDKIVIATCEQGTHTNKKNVYIRFTVEREWQISLHKHDRHGIAAAAERSKPPFLE